MKTKKPNYFIYYNNGHFECCEKLNFTLMHLIDIGIIKVIFDNEQQKVWIRGNEGTMIERKVDDITNVI